MLDCVLYCAIVCEVDGCHLIAQQSSQLCPPLMLADVCVWEFLSPLLNRKPQR